MVCYWSMKSPDIYFIRRNKTSFSKSWTRPSRREDPWYSHLDASGILVHPSYKPSQGGGRERHGHGSVNLLLQIQNISTHHVLYLPDKISSQFLKLHNLSLGTWNPVAFIPTHVALSHWHGWRIKLLDCRICAMSSPGETEKKMLPVRNSAQIKRSSSPLHVCLISLFSLRQCILEEWWTACSADTLPLPSSPPTPLFKPDQLCAEATDNSSSTGQQHRHQEGGGWWHVGTQGVQLARQIWSSPAARTHPCNLLVHSVLQTRALQREEWNPW